AVPTEKDVRGLDVAVHETAGFCLRQRVTYLTQQVDSAIERDRPETTDEGIGVHAVEEFHHVVERAVVGDPEIEECDRVRGMEAGGGLRFALEPAHRLSRDTDTAIGAAPGPNQLDRRSPSQKAMASAPDLAHATLSQLLFQTVAPQLPRSGHFATEPVDHP